MEVLKSLSGLTTKGLVFKGSLQLRLELQPHAKSIQIGIEEAVGPGCCSPTLHVGQGDEDSVFISGDLLPSDVDQNLAEPVAKLEGRTIVRL